MSRVLDKCRRSLWLGGTVLVVIADPVAAR